MTGKGIEKYTGSAGRSGKLRREGEMVEKVQMEWAVGRASAWGEDAEKLIKRRRSSWKMCEQGGRKSNVDGARGGKILVEERERAGED